VSYYEGKWPTLSAVILSEAKDFLTRSGYSRSKCFVAGSTTSAGVCDTGLRKAPPVASGEQALPGGIHREALMITLFPT